MCLLAAAAVSVAGCVGMPGSGPVREFSVSPQTPAPNRGYIGPIPSGPGAHWSPKQIVQGFLLASASYPEYSEIARQYLLGSASRKWNPGWSVTVFSNFTVPRVAVAQRPGRGPQATVDVSGSVQATFRGIGQFVSAHGQGPAKARYQFTLVKVDGEWRISNPPDYRLLTTPEFAQFYKPQDLYFISPLDTEALVPEAVFVPLATPTAALARNLVQVLLQGPKATWLENAAGTFPAGTKLLNVYLDGTNAVVNLGGAMTGASQEVREQVSAQLVWTLAGPRTGPPGPVQSVELQINGRPWVPPKTICGVTQSRSSVQNQAAYSCYDPYPSVPTSFAFTDQGRVWARCGSVSSARQGSIGPVVPVFRRGGAAPQRCDGKQLVLTGSTAVPQAAPLPPSVGTPLMTAVSPDGHYVACYSPDKHAVFTGPASDRSGLTKVQGGVGSGVTALSWDRSDNLWIAQDDGIWTMPVTGKPTPVQTQFTGPVTAMSVAPDGVRMAVIVRGGPQNQVQLAAITRGVPPGNDQHGSPSLSASLGPVLPLAPNLTRPAALTWYDADNLIVLDNASSGSTLSEVPVDGQYASTPQPAPAGAVSITAHGAMNALVAGIEHGTLSVSTGLEAPWQPLGVHGQYPAYPG